MSVTIKDVSKDAGVSIKTVSRVINNEDNVSESTKEKVLKSVTKLGFKPNKSAQSLRSKRSYMIVCFTIIQINPILLMFREGFYKHAKELATILSFKSAIMRTNLYPRPL
jgi:DNA-binding LacI/PurR family transcriptional regulator